MLRGFHPAASLTTALSTATALELPARLTTWPKAPRDVVFLREILGEIEVLAAGLETLVNN
jgi:hypothetical protein